jgi:hypothetical protein
MRGYMRVLASLLAAGLLQVILRADERTQKLLDRLAQEAEAFEKAAPQVMGIETLYQRALMPPPRFKVRVGKAAEQPLAPTWQEREIVSEYGFAVFGGGSIQELRQVMVVNGKRIADQRKAQDDLARLVTGNNEERKRRALQQLEKYGFRGGATDFGQILLLFSRSAQERYEITYQGESVVSPMRVQTFHYKQLDGPEALTLFRQNQAYPAQHLNVEGEIWVREPDGAPVRITLVATDASSDQVLREEATVDYSPSEFGTVLPLETNHKELRAGEVVTENRFTYAGFHRFGAARR